MTFYIPPVFLFGNNDNRFHNNEEKKSEYKTAAETEIKVENWRVKRIAELEEENKELKEWAEENSYLKAENKKLEVENRKLRIELSAYDREYFDEDKKAAFIFSDFGGYDEDVAN